MLNYLGDAGKSTFAKQVNLMFSEGPMKEEFTRSFVEILRENCLVAMQQLLEFLNNNLSVPESLKPVAEEVLIATTLTMKTAKNILKIWESFEFQLVVQKVEIGALKYYFPNSLRFAEEKFAPSIQDILYARRKTTGIIETQFIVQNTYLFTLVDVGGRRSERKKWGTSFESGGISAVLYICALNEYDMTIEEDSKTNRLADSLKLWRNLTGSSYFKTTPFILLLNKSDLFKEKIKVNPLMDLFTDYTTFTSRVDLLGLDDFTLGWKYMAMQYQVHFCGSAFYPHVICSIDPDSCRKVFDSIREVVMKEIENSHRHELL
jgi:hypothetical protein